MTSVLGKSVNSLRKVLPPSAVPLVVRGRSRVARRRPAVWADAKAQMRFVVGEDQPDVLIDRLAAAYLERSIWRGESRWHPELVTRQRVVGVDHLHALRDTGTGFLINFVHHGDYEGICPSLARVGIPSHAVVASEVLSPDAPVWQQQQGRVCSSVDGVTLVDVAVGSAGIRERLERGRAVALATDQPGHTPVRFLGRDLLLSSGAARVARQTGVPVVVVTSHRNLENPDACAVLEISEPLRPASFDSVEDLLMAMLKSHEQAFIDWPEAAEHPLRMLDRSLARPTTGP